VKKKRLRAAITTMLWKTPEKSAWVMEISTVFLLIMPGIGVFIAPLLAMLSPLVITMLS
jgi:hypothetical protein